MKIKFKVHQEIEREVELSQQELLQLFEMMKMQFKEHITFGSFGNSYPTKTEQCVTMFCNQRDVDVEYEKDRVNFFTAILDNLKNPYQ